MALDLTQIRTIAILMLENRSFDHLFSHLSLAGHPVDGLKGTINADGRVMNDAYANGFEGRAYYPFRMADGKLPADPPHGRDEVQTQFAVNPVTGRLTMRGFVKAYYTPGMPNRTQTPEVMGFLAAEDAPISSFLAREYGVCDRWFAPIPANTHPNRMFALSGYTKIDRIAKIPIIPGQTTMLDWLSARNVRWRVYRNGLSFFMLMPQYLDNVALGDGFRSVSHLEEDILNEPDATYPEVMLIEPAYFDSPVDLEDAPNDNHPPLPLAPGEAYLKRIYDALTANPQRWASTLFIVTYDEHGGFYDHVPPPLVPAPVPVGASYQQPFKSTGVRVPAMAISPFVPRGSVCSQTLDHTSILQLLAERFDAGGGGYSPEGNARRSAGIQSASVVLGDQARPDVPPTPAAPAVPGGLVKSVRPATTPLQVAFADAAKKLAANPASAATHPGLREWNS